MTIDVSNDKLRETAKTAFYAAAIGTAAGGFVGAFRWWYDLTSSYIVGVIAAHDIHNIGSAFFIFGALFCLALISGHIVKREPLVSGSGIPHVEFVIAGKAKMPWFKVMALKFVGTWISLTGGLSVGREGPSIQMGAAVGRGISGLWGGGDAPNYVLAGGVAGLAAAFSAPFACVLFAFEELKAKISAKMATLVCVTAFVSWLVVRYAFGFGLVFGFKDVVPFGWRQYAIPVAMGVVTGCLGAFYNLTLMRIVNFFDRQRAGLWRALPAFMLAGVLLYVYPLVITGVGFSSSELHNVNMSAAAVLVLLIVKFSFSLMSFSSGAAGGILMPMLGIGSLAGACALKFCSGLDIIPAEQAATLVILGMAGLFAGAVRSPLTGAILVAEMTGAFTCLPELLITAEVAAITANMTGSAPIYESLKERIAQAAHKMA